MSPVTFEDIQHAALRIDGEVCRTPVLTCRTLNDMTGATLYFKCENFQRAGAFKYRGATNAILLLTSSERERGVTTHSSGNHAGALALAARCHGVPAFVVMPRTAPRVKVDAVQDYGAVISFCEPTLAARESTLKSVQRETGATFVHPYDNPKVIAGQGTAALELIEEAGELDVVMAPVGGGGLLSGTAITTASLLPDATILGAEPAGADDAFRSHRDKKRYPSVNPDTIADGLLTSLGELTFPVVRDRVHGIRVVDDAGIVAAMRLIWERMKIVVEPSAAVPLAAVMAYPDDFAGKRVGLILSGGNVDLGALPWGNNKESP